MTTKMKTDKIITKMNTRSAATYGNRKEAFTAECTPLYDGCLTYFVIISGFCPFLHITSCSHVRISLSVILYYICWQFCQLSWKSSWSHWFYATNINATVLYHSSHQLVFTFLVFNIFYWSCWQSQGSSLICFNPNKWTRIIWQNVSARAYYLLKKSVPGKYILNSFKSVESWHWE